MIDYQKLTDMLDQALANETEETWNNYLNECQIEKEEDVKEVQQEN